MIYSMAINSLLTKIHKEEKHKLLCISNRKKKKRKTLHELSYKWTRVQRCSTNTTKTNSQHFGCRIHFAEWQLLCIYDIWLSSLGSMYLDYTFYFCCCYRNANWNFSIEIIDNISTNERKTYKFVTFYSFYIISYFYFSPKFLFLLLSFSLFLICILIFALLPRLKHGKISL